MPEYYNSAAQLLYMLQKSGLVFRQTTDPRDTVWLLAELMTQHFEGYERLRHAEAADRLFVAIERNCVCPNNKCRAKLVAIIGTYIGNMEVRLCAA